jgi:hypothetical protein
MSAMGIITVTTAIVTTTAVIGLAPGLIAAR